MDYTGDFPPDLGSTGERKSARISFTQREQIKCTLELGESEECKLALSRLLQIIRSPTPRI